MQPSPRQPLEPMTPLQPMVPLQPMTPLDPIGSEQVAYVPSLALPTTPWEPPPEGQQWAPPLPQGVPPQPPPQQGIGLQLPVRFPRPPANTNKIAGVVIGTVTALIVGLAALGSKTSTDNGPDISIPSISIPDFGATHGSTGSSQHPAPTIASLGQSRVLNGNIDGQSVRVTFTHWVNDAKSKDSFFGPSPGKRYVAAQFRVFDLGSVQYIDSPSNGAYVFDRSGRKYRTTFAVSGIRGGKVFPAALSLAKGESATGYLVFEVPKHAKISKVQFSENSGFGQIGHWSIKR